MPLDLDQLALVRDEIGFTEPPSTPDLDDIYDRKGGLVGVVRVVWSQRLADLFANPASFSISGEYSQSTGDNMKYIQARLAELSGVADDSDEIPSKGAPSTVLVSYQLVRPDCER